jgi:hypothetical protein
MSFMDQKLRAHWPVKSHLRQLEFLEAAGCVTIGDVLNERVTEAQMLRVPGVGRETLRFVKSAVVRAVVDWSCRY